jgi:hypothetical protein
MVVFNYDFIPWNISFKINFDITQVNSYANLGPQGHQKGQKNPICNSVKIFKINQRKSKIL